MTRDKFIKKWLANPDMKYNEHFRDEMRKDLDRVIKCSEIRENKMKLPLNIEI
jgi:hypothetical protein